MQPRIYLIFQVLFLGLVTGLSCHKPKPGFAATRHDLIDQASSFIHSQSQEHLPANYRAAQPKTVRWDMAEVVAVGSTTGLLAPITFDSALLIRANFDGERLFHLDYLSRLLFYRDSTGRDVAEVITDFPDSNFFADPTAAFTGIRFVEDWQGNPIDKLLCLPGGQVKRFVKEATQSAAVSIIQTCYTITGYNYSPATGETYTWSEPAGCSVSYVDEGFAPSYGGTISPPGAGGGGRPAATVDVLPGNSVIKSIQRYFQCFTNVGGADHHYSVTVCVDQPDPGTRTPWTISSGGSSGSSAGNNPVDAGHAFLILTETYGSTTITRNVGFYPAGNVNPLNLTSQGALNDDETHIYNISGTFSVDNAQFFNILNFIAEGSTLGYLYNLNTNNCTTFVINAAQQGGINLPRTIGTWPEGAGEDPGDLGEDIRNNSIPGMTVNTAGGSGNSHYNAGQCN